MVVYHGSDVVVKKNISIFRRFFAQILAEEQKRGGVEDGALTHLGIPIYLFFFLRASLRENNE